MFLGYRNLIFFCVKLDLWGNILFMLWSLATLIIFITLEPFQDTILKYNFISEF